jgi:hypothetical protein
VKALLRNGTPLVQMPPPRPSELTQYCQYVQASPKLSNRLANEKFGSLALQFMKQAHQQMGVQIFMMIGYKNEQGQTLKAK